jgi:hypothetical protein
MKTLLTVSAFALVLAISCQNNAADKNQVIAAHETMASQQPSAKSEEMDYNVSADTIAVPTAPTAAPDQQPGQPAPKQKPSNSIPAPVRPDWNKKIIRNASLELEIKDFKTFENQVSAIAGKYSGYIAEENQEGSDYRIQSKVSIRVPVELFDQAVNELTGKAEKILAKNITSKDVTGEVVDLRSRLEAKRQARLRYLELMKQAKNMEEVFQVQKEVDAIQEEIEAAAGRVGYLNHSAAYSTIQLTYFQILNPDLVNNKDREPSFGNRILEAFGSGFKWLGDLMVVLITLWPLILGVVVLVYILKKMMKQHRPKSTAGAVIEPPKI